MSAEAIEWLNLLCLCFCAGAGIQVFAQTLKRGQGR